MIESLKRILGREPGSKIPESFDMVQQDVLEQFYLASKIEGHLRVGLDWMILMEYLERGTIYDIEQVKADVAQATEELERRGFIESVHDGYKIITQRGEYAWKRLRIQRHRFFGATVKVPSEI